MTPGGSQQPTFASFYDFYDGPEGRESQFEMYLSLAAESGGPVLELGCGTCIIAIEIARAGFEITGLDNSPDMLNVAREKIAREDANVRSRVRLVEGNMREFRLDQRFNLIFIATNTFECLTELNDHKGCLRAVHDHLNPQGVAVIEERQYSPHTLVRMSEQVGLMRQSTAGINPLTGLYTVRLSVGRHVDFSAQRIYSRSFIEELQEDGTVRRYPASGVPGRGPHYWDIVHYFTRFELQLLIEGAGLTVRDVWGGYDRSHLRSDSQKMILVAQKS